MSLIASVKICNKHSNADSKKAFTGAVVKLSEQFIVKDCKRRMRDTCTH